ncbi:hypothetical protein JB92DRAFT_2813122 [Gautieria morchelliformis]|nr:hypothetical protein JB92DRAFT_2813122 [Gautieria morchelliformis]
MLSTGQALAFKPSENRHCSARTTSWQIVPAISVRARATRSAEMAQKLCSDSMRSDHIYCTFFVT